MLKKIIFVLSVILLLPLYSSAIEIPGDARLDYNQGIDYYKLGMYERAIESFRSAINACPEYIDAYYNLGTILEYLKQDAEALNVFKQIYMRNPNDYEVIYKMAKLSINQEDYEMASKYITLIPPSSKFYQSALELSESVKEHTELPVQKVNPPSKIATQTGIYENIMSPTGITTDSFGNLYVATFSDNAIIKITPENKRTVFIKSSQISGPISLESDFAGNIYVANYNKRKI